MVVVVDEKEEEEEEDAQLLLDTPALAGAGIAHQNYHQHHPS